MNDFGDRSSSILVVVDASNFEYMCIFSAAARWEKLHSDESKLVLKETVWKTDQDNLPELLNYDSFRRVLKFVVQDKLEQLRSIISNNHQGDIDCATDVDVFFALDGELEKNFRKRLYPEYKAQRDLARQRFSIKNLKPYIQDVLFKELGLETALGYRIVKVDGCESDDIIATIFKNYTGYMKRILFSSDKDFLQLKDVIQYDCWGKRVERTIRDVVDEPVGRNDFLLWKIIRGDQSDNIKNVFPKYGDKKSWELVNDRKKLRQMLSENNSAFERFKLNSTLIDFDNIPKDYTKRIMKVVDEKLSEKSFSGEFSLEECMVV